MPEKGVTGLHGRGRTPFDWESCAPDQVSTHKVLNQRGQMEIYLPQANIVYLDLTFLNDLTLTVCIVKM